jgi:hypothetical protein
MAVPVLTPCAPYLLVDYRFVLSGRDAYQEVA